MKDPSIFTAKALVLLNLNRSWDAIITLHEALAVSPQDPMATDLLNRALEINESDSGLLESGTAAGSDMAEDADENDEMEELDRRMNGKLREIEQNRVAGRRSRRRRHAQGVADDDLSAFGESMVVDSDEG
jgi:anaphase-promoting complex subunit 6